MVTTSALKVLKTRCEGLRWKSMFIETEGDAEMKDASGSNFWCVYTQKPIGPDGEIVAEDTCTASRSCYNGL